MSEISVEAKKELEKMALKATEKLMDIAIDSFRESCVQSRRATDINMAAYHNAALAAVEAAFSKQTKPEQPGVT